MKAISIRLDTRKLDSVRRDLGPRAEDILTRAGVDIQAHATQNTTRVDTGAMKNGWRVIQERPFQRTIYNTQEYAIYHEMGTAHMGAAPMLVPAVETVRGNLAGAWRRLFS